MVQREYGAPEVLHAEELPEPALRDTDVLVEVRATSVNPVDTKVRARPSVPRELPLVLGYDVSGTVVRCGPRRISTRSRSISSSSELDRVGMNTSSM